MLRCHIQQTKLSLRQNFDKALATGMVVLVVCRLCVSILPLLCYVFARSYLFFIISEAWEVRRDLSRLFEGELVRQSSHAFVQLTTKDVPFLRHCIVPMRAPEVSQNQRFPGLTEYVEAFDGEVQDGLLPPMQPLPLEPLFLQVTREYFKIKKWSLYEDLAQQIIGNVVDTAQSAGIRLDPLILVRFCELADAGITMYELIKQLCPEQVEQIPAWLDKDLKLKPVVVVRCDDAWSFR